MSVVIDPSITAAATPGIGLELQPVGGRLGAEVRGLRLNGDLSPEVIASLRAALHANKVLFLRDQHHLDDATQQAFSRLWGELVEHPTVPSRDGTRIFELDSRHGGRANSWHTDVTFDVAPPQVSILRAVVIPERGGDTVWADAVAAYSELPAPLRALADQLWAVHGNDYDYAATRVEPDDAGAQRYRKVFTARLIESEHPLVRVHPVTGERAIVAGHFLKRFVGYNSADSRHLFSLFQDHVTRLENTVRWRWAVGDVAIWDNRATQHYAINDYGGQHRVMRRVTIAGDVPVSVDGRRSRRLAHQHG
ncbi:MAG: TauD/TfdA family dioxygenase [Burkholderiaceae bacterium]